MYNLFVSLHWCFAIVNYLLIFATILFSIPMIIQMYNYLIVRTTSYLYFSALFIFIIIDIIIVAINPKEFFIEALITLSYIAIYFILIHLSLEMYGKPILLKGFYWKLYYLIILFITLLLKVLIHQNIINQNFTFIRIGIGETIRLSAGFIIIFAFSKSKPIVPSKRTRLIQKLWIVCGIIILIIALVRFAIYNLLSLESFQFINIFSENTVSSLIDIADLTSDLGIFLLALITMLTAIFFPETLLLSYNQIIKVLDLYDLILEENLKKNKSPKLKTLSALHDYIKSIPKDLQKHKKY